MTNIFKVYPTVLSVAAFLLFFLSSSSGFGQSLATIGDEDAVGAGIGYSFLDFFSSTNLSVGFSSKKVIETAFSYSMGSDSSKTAGFAIALYPFSANRIGGFGLLAGASKGARVADVGLVVSYGLQIYLTLQSKEEYLLLGLSKVAHNATQVSIGPDSFTSTSFGVEMGLIHPTQVRPSAGLSITKINPRIGTLISISIGVRLPVKSKS